jgi:hypothetical protein
VASVLLSSTAALLGAGAAGGEVARASVGVEAVGTRRCDCRSRRGARGASGGGWELLCEGAVGAGAGVELSCSTTGGGPGIWVACSTGTKSSSKRSSGGRVWANSSSGSGENIVDGSGAIEAVAC